MFSANCYYPCQPRLLPYHPKLIFTDRNILRLPYKNIVPFPTLKCNFSRTMMTPLPAFRSKTISFLEEGSSSPSLIPDYFNNSSNQINLMILDFNNNPSKTRTRAKKSDKDSWYKEFYPYPKMTEKPEWFWRSLAAIFYLKAILQFGAYGIFDPAFKISPMLKNLGELTYEPYVRFIACFPQWMWYVYQTGVYFTARKKEFPHYLRFHMINGLLIDVGLDILYHVNRWFPYSWLWSKIGMHVLTAIGIAYVLTILECIRSALAGMYADAPFLSQSSFIHTQHVI